MKEQDSSKMLKRTCQHCKQSFSYDPIKRSDPKFCNLQCYWRYQQSPKIYVKTRKEQSIDMMTVIHASFLLAFAFIMAFAVYSLVI